ncbi:MAG: RNA polymerase sigma factor [Planctomycetota bacterium]
MEAAASPSQPWEDEPGALTPLRELQLLEAHHRGEPEATTELLSAYQRRIYAVCYRMVRHTEDARDLTQDAMVKVLQGLGTYDRRAKLSTWIIRVTMNCCLSHLRKQKLRRHASLEQPSREGAAAEGVPAGGEQTPPARVEQAELRSVLSRALGRLDPQTRALLVLRDLQDLGYQEIAGVLDVPLGTVKSRLFRARAALREAAGREVGTDLEVDDLQ